MSQLNKIQERFIELRKGLGMGQTEFANTLNIKQSQVSQIETGSREIPISIKIAIEENLNVTRSWVDTGLGSRYSDGGMLYNSLKKNGEKKHHLNEPDTEYKITEVKNKRVPIYNMEFSAGTISRLINGGANDFQVGYLSIPEVSGCDAIIMAKGQSMSPRINDGDLLGIKKIEDWDKWLPMGYIYAIDTKDLQIVKYIKKGKSKDTYTIVSENKHYEDDEIPKGIINEIWAVKTILPFSRIETLI